MAFEKGKNKTGGRKAGTPNKSTIEFRNVLAIEIQAEHKSFWERLRNLDDFQYSQIYLKLMNFYLPKPSQALASFDGMSESEKEQVILQIAEKMNELRNK